MTGTPHARVQRGVQWLDAAYPGWVNTINLEKLNLRSECACVLGQLAFDVVNADEPPGVVTYATYWDIVIGLGHPRCPVTLAQDHAASLGFNIDGGGEQAAWGDLQYEWEIVIKERLGA